MLSNYGDVFEVWFDGANGGDGYYGGAKETRRVDKKKYYDWENTRKIIDELQPNAVGFSDAGPHVRWVGNEHGFAYETTWSPLLKDSVYGGMPNYNTKYSMGQENGTHWVPAEADVSIRPGWYYHESEDDKVKTLEQLLEIYYRSVGQNSTLLLNFPVDTRGLIHENDEKQLKKLTKQLKLDFANNLALNKKIKASNTRGSSSKFDATNVNDNSNESYWTTDDGVIQASLTVDLEKPTEINRFLIQEHIALGQRIKQFSLEVEVDGNWKTIGNHTTVGYKRILRFDKIIATKIRLNIEDSKACPLISNIEVYNAPVIVDVPQISRTKEGLVHLKIPEKGVEVYYTVEGSDPTMSSSKYLKEFMIEHPTTIKAFSFDPISKRKSDIVTVNLDISKHLWKITNLQGVSYTEQSIDDDNRTNWTANSNMLSNYRIDLGKLEKIKGFTYTPNQSRWVSGIITHYSFYGSINGKNWKKLAQGEFSNVLANPIQQKINFEKPSEVRYIKLMADKIMNNDTKAVIGEIGVISN